MEAFGLTAKNEEEQDNEDRYEEKVKNDERTSFTRLSDRNIIAKT